MTEDETAGWHHRLNGHGFGSCRDQEGRRGSEEAVPGPSVNRSMPGPPVHHQLPEFTQTHVH